MVKKISYEKSRKARLVEGRKLLAEKVKLEKQQLKSKEFEQKTKEKRKTAYSKLKKQLSRKIISKRILKPTKSATLTIKKSEPAEYVSRYFKDEWEETKKSLFK